MLTPLAPLINSDFLAGQQRAGVLWGLHLDMQKLSAIRTVESE
jgi:hypothetical protein